jgi:hypothetical protein
VTEMVQPPCRQAADDVLLRGLSVGEHRTADHRAAPALSAPPQGVSSARSWLGARGGVVTL